MKKMSIEYTDSALVDQFYNISGTGIFQKKKYHAILSAITPNSRFTLNVMEDNIYEFFTMRKDEFKLFIKEAIFRFLENKYADSEVRYEFRNLEINLISDSTVKMHDLNAREHERTIITFDCEVIAVEREKTYVKKSTGHCPSCFQDQEVKCDYERELTNIICNNIKCRKGKIVINKEGLITDNIQYIYLQELLSDARNSSPVMMRAVALDELSGSIYVGQKKRITCIYKSVIDLTKPNVNDILLEIISSNDLEEKETNCLTDDQLNSLKEASKQTMFIDKVINSFAPLIIGYSDIKFSILLMLAGGYSKVKRGDINLLLVGDPSLAKSELLKECSKVSHKSMYTSGRGASAAGLTIGLVKMENGNYVAQAGVLPLCSDGHACIDEFDKMNPNDRSAMHEAMEQQTVSIAKAGFRMTLPAKTSILAAANPKYGKYDTSMTLIDNIDIPVPLVSRFDLVWLIRDSVNVDEDSKKAQHVLDTFTGNDMSNKVFLSRNELSSYLNHIRSIKPEISDEAKIKLAEIYQKMRSLSNSNESLTVGIRQLEALARLSTAHAKLLFKNIVDIYDVLAVEKLLKNMFESLGVNMDKGFTQATLVVSKKENKEHIAIKTWLLCEDKDKHVKYSIFINKLVETNQFDTSSAKSLFENWERNCIVKLIGDGEYQKL